MISSSRIISSILQMQKSGHKELKWLFQDAALSLCSGWDENPRICESHCGAAAKSFSCSGGPWDLNSGRWSSRRGTFVAFFPSETLICCHSSSVRQKSYHYQRLDGSSLWNTSISLQGMACTEDGSKNANSIQLWLLRSKKSNCCIAASFCS